MAVESRPGADLATAAKPPLGLVLMLGTLTALGPLAIDMYLPALPLIAKDFGASDASAQRTVTFFLAGLCLGQLVYGPLSDRFGRRGPILIGIGLYLLGTAGCLLAPSMTVLTIARVVQALGACAGMVLSRAVVRDRFKASEILHVLSLLMLVMGLAPILAPMLGAWLLLVGDWRLIFGFQLLAAVVIGAAVLFGLSETRSAETAALARGENPIASYVRLLSKRRLIAFLIAGAFSGAVLFTYIASAPDVVMVQHHVSAQVFSWIFSANAVAIIGATQVNAWLARRWPGDLILRRALAFALVIALLLLGAAASGFGGLLAIGASLFLILGSYGFTQSNTQAEALKVDASRAGSVSALTGAASFGAGAIASGVASLVRDGTPVPMAAVMAGSLAIALLALWRLAPLRR